MMQISYWVKYVLDLPHSGEYVQFPLVLVLPLIDPSIVRSSNQQVPGAMPGHRSSLIKAECWASSKGSMLQ